MSLGNPGLEPLYLLWFAFMLTLFFFNLQLASITTHWLSFHNIKNIYINWVHKLNKIVNYKNVYSFSPIQQQQQYF